MAAIISDKFRIFNASQFLESLSEAEDTKMYFFVGRPQRWDAYLEIFSANSTAFVAGNEVYVGANYASATFKGVVREVYENSLLLYSVGPTTTSTPGVGSQLKGYNGISDTGAQALTGVYRYATEDVPPVPLDNQTEKYDVYDDIIAAKRITTDFARSVIRRFNWDLSANPVFDMWKPDYSTTPGSGGQVGKTAATGATNIADAKYYLINSQYEVFKCLYNGQNPANPSGQTATNEPKTTPSAGQGSYDAATGKFTEDSGAAGGYIWKYMYTIPTDDVLRFLSTDFMPIVLPTNQSRIDTTAIATAAPNSIDVAIIEDGGQNLPNGTHYAPIVGDGTGGVVEIVVGSGSISGVTVTNPGRDYTYATVALATGLTSADPGWTGSAYGVYTNDTFATAVTIDPVTATGAIEVILPPQGGHGANFEEELNAKRVMTNIRLTYAEGSGDFPVDNDFRRIGIIKDPYAFGTTTVASTNTLNGVYAARIENATADYQVDETIRQTVATGGFAYGTVVSWELDAGNAGPGGTGVLKWIQSPSLHTDAGVVRTFEASANNIEGLSSLAAGDVITTADDAIEANVTVSGVTFSNGLATPEIENNSGEIIYVENRRLITRAADQIEDIKLVIEF
jgi:hypothetical protein